MKLKLIQSGSGNSGSFADMYSKVMKQKAFRYIVVTSSGGESGRIGGSFNFGFHGTNSLKDLLTPEILQNQKAEIIDTKDGKKVEKSNLAKMYLESLTPKEKSDLIDSMLIAHLTS